MYVGHWSNLLPIMEDRVENSSEELEVHDQVQQVYGEVERVESETKEAEGAVQDMVEHHLEWWMKERSTEVDRIELYITP